MYRLSRPLVVAMVAVLGLTGCARTDTAADATSMVESYRSDSMPLSSTSGPVAVDPCADAEMPVTAGGIDGAMGERFVALIVTNCGTTPLELSGYPEIEVLDEAEDPVGITAQPDLGPDGVVPTSVAPVTVPAGEQAYVALRWRNTTGTDGAPVTGAYARVAGIPSVGPQDVALRLDLGTTNALYMSGWALLTQ